MQRKSQEHHRPQLQPRDSNRTEPLALLYPNEPMNEADEQAMIGAKANQ
jgi:hypothetical protein